MLHHCTSWPQFSDARPMPKKLIPNSSRTSQLGYVGCVLVLTLILTHRRTPRTPTSTPNVFLRVRTRTNPTMLLSLGQMAPWYPRQRCELATAKIITGWWCNNHLEKYEFVNGKDDIPYINHIWNGKWKPCSKPPTRKSIGDPNLTQSLRNRADESWQMLRPHTWRSTRMKMMKSPGESPFRTRPRTHVVQLPLPPPCFVADPTASF